MKWKTSQCQYATNLLGRAAQACCTRPSKPLDVDGFPKRAYGANKPTKAMSTTTPTKRSAAYNSNSDQKSLPLFWTSANVAQQESMTICTAPNKQYTPGMHMPQKQDQNTVTVQVGMFLGLFPLQAIKLNEWCRRKSCISLKIISWITSAQEWKELYKLFEYYV